MSTRTPSFIPVQDEIAHAAFGSLSTGPNHPGVPALGKPKPGTLVLSRGAQMLSLNWLVLGFMLLFHLGAIAALFFFSWPALIVAVVLHLIAINAGIGMGYHRLLTHRGYAVPRWLEHLLAVNWWVALLTGGEGWHNNHHAYPVSARHGLAWYEFDLNYCGIG